jgi:hypothetical protein
MNVVKMVALGWMLDTITAATMASDCNIYEQHPAVLGMDLALTARPPMSSTVIVCSSIFVNM